MNYAALEDEIVARLEIFENADVTVQRLPETESERINVITGKTRLTVIYAGSEYEGSNSTSQVSQTEKVFVQILIESTFLRGTKGIYNLTSVIKKLLTGFRPQNLTRLQVSKHHTIGQPDMSRESNMWQYQIVFQGNSLHVEDFEEDETVLISQINYNDGAETIVVPPEPN